MRLEVSAERLRHAVKLVNPIVDVYVGAANQPILCHILLEADSGGLTVHAADYEVGMTVWVEGAKVEAPGAVLVKSEVLKAFLDHTKGDVARIEMTANGRLGLRVGRARTVLPVLEADRYPVRVWGDSQPLLRLTLDDWLALLKPGLPYHRYGDERFAYEATQVWVRADRIEAASSDGHRLCVVTLRQRGGPDTRRALLSNRFLRQVVSVIGKGGDTVFGTLGSGGNMYDFSVEGMRVMVRQPGKTFPSMDRVLAFAPDERVLVDRKQLDEALDAAKKFADQGEMAYPRITAEYKEQAVWLTAGNHTAGSFEISLPASTLGCEPFQMMLNPAYLAKALEACNGVAEVCLFRPGVQAPLEVRPGDGMTDEVRIFIWLQHS